MEPWELTVREQVRDLLARYTWAGDRGRIADLVDLFTASGVLDVGAHGGRWEGRAAIEAGLRAVVERAASGDDGGGGGSEGGGGGGGRGGGGPVHHHVTSVLIGDVTTGSATVRSYYAVHTAIGLDHWGRYRDRVVEADGRWRFAERVVTVDGSAAGSHFVSG